MCWSMVGYVRGYAPRARRARGAQPLTSLIIIQHIDLTNIGRQTGRQSGRQADTQKHACARAEGDKCV